MHPQFTPVTSSNIDGYHYMSDRKVLLVTFKTSGHTYAYEDVEQSVVTRFANASSKGQFFGSDIRDRYTTSKLDEMALANLMGGLGTSMPPSQPRRKAPRISLQSLLLRYPMLNAVF